MQLTNTTVKNLPSPLKRQKFYFDAKMPGFGVRVSSGGNRSYIVQYRSPTTRKRKRHTIGKASILSADIARAEAKRILACVALGEDPFVVSELTLEIAWQEFLTRHMSKKSAGYQRLAENFWRLHCPAELKQIPVNKLTRAMLMGPPLKLVAEGSSGSARFAQKILNVLFRQLENNGQITHNVLRGTNAVASVGVRTRVLSEHELKTLWNSLHKLNDTDKLIAQLLLTTGARISEIAELRKTEVDLPNRFINLSAERVKNRTAHKLPIPEPIAEQMELYFSPVGLLYFAKILPITLRSRMVKASGVTNHTIHDLRRTCATQMARLGVAPHVIEAMLNHKSGIVSGIASVYNTHDYIEEIRDAQRRLYGFLESDVTKSI